MKRVTVYFEDDLHKALKLKAAEASSSVSDLVNQAIRESLSEDLDDLQAFRDRESEPTMDFETFLKSLKSDGRL
ncbi:CopG family transcriptional regulator [Pelagicoccus sp. NFK12]|uniref:CopG family transcriptional regulator n=1 Tax=Pelagicoccus enzymogenes TaxID=2773457 RepID=A0A927IFL5_9BACT|nr:CopG family transcriptional regulator [Pelagicoccus enzymogenes]MBD5778231.1 CopG family transcriptional regulator [Pelagicoccus enzymogenes]